MATCLQLHRHDTGDPDYCAGAAIRTHDQTGGVRFTLVAPIDQVRVDLPLASTPPPLESPHYRPPVRKSGRIPRATAGHAGPIRCGVARVARPAAPGAQSSRRTVATCPFARMPTNGWDPGLPATYQIASSVRVTRAQTMSLALNRAKKSVATDLLAAVSMAYSRDVIGAGLAPGLGRTITAHCRGVDFDR